MPAIDSSKDRRYERLLQRITNAALEGRKRMVLSRKELKLVGSRTGVSHRHLSVDMLSEIIAERVADKLI